MNYPRRVYVLVDCEGIVHRNVDDPSLHLLHRANFVAVTNARGTFDVWKDREVYPNPRGVDFDFVEQRVDHFVEWAQFAHMAPSAASGSAYRSPSTVTEEGVQ